MNDLPNFQYRIYMKSYTRIITTESEEVMLNFSDTLDLMGLLKDD